MNEHPAPKATPPAEGEVRVELAPDTEQEPRIELLQARGRCTCGFFAMGLTTTSPGEHW